MFYYFLKFSKQNVYTGDEGKREICIPFRMLGANCNIKMKGNCKVLVSCFLHLAVSQVKVVALCAGSGSSVLQGAEADVYLTGRQPLGFSSPLFVCLCPFPTMVYFLQVKKANFRTAPDI